MPRLLATSTALPPHEISQEDARALCERALREESAGERAALRRLLPVFARAGVERRFLAFPPSYYLAERSFEERNADFITEAAALAERAARGALERAGTPPERLDHLFLVTTTGLATPSLDAILAPRLGLRPEARRHPLFGLGCAGGAGALARAADVLAGAPEARALVVAVELCGQVFSPRALRPVDVVGAALFGDGAAAAVVGGEAAADSGPRIRASRSILFAGTGHLMGWTFDSQGLRLVLAQGIPAFVKEALRPALEAFLSDLGLALGDVSFWALHPGGRRVIEAYLDALGLEEAQLEWTRRSLRSRGNLSSASVLATLADIIESGRPRAGDRALVLGLGPGFAAELVMLEW